MEASSIEISSYNPSISLSEIIQNLNSEQVKIQLLKDATNYLPAQEQGHLSQKQFFAKFYMDVLYKKIDNQAKDPQIKRIQEISTLLSVKLVEIGVEINHRFKRFLHETCLIKAVKENQIETVRLLLAQPDIDPNITNQYGDAALHLAADNQNLHIIELLIKAKADINQKDGQDCTPMIRFLQSIDQPSREGKKKRKLAKILQFLLNNHADVNISTQQGSIPLHFAVLSHQYELVCLLVDQSDINKQDVDLFTPLHHAVTHAVTNLDFDIIKVLVNKGADLTLRNIFNLTPLTLMDIYGNDQIKSFISNLQLGHQQDWEDQNQLNYISYKRFETVNRLLNWGNQKVKDNLEKHLNIAGQQMK